MGIRYLRASAAWGARKTEGDGGGMDTDGGSVRLGYHEVEDN